MFRLHLATRFFGSKTGVANDNKIIDLIFIEVKFVYFCSQFETIETKFC